MKLSNICCVITWMGDRLSIALCSGSMHEPCVGLQYFHLRPACLRLTNIVQFSSIEVFHCCVSTWMGDRLGGFMYWVCA